MQLWCGRRLPPTRRTCTHTDGDCRRKALHAGTCHNDRCKQSVECRHLRSQRREHSRAISLDIHSFRPESGTERHQRQPALFQPQTLLSIGRETGHFLQLLSAHDSHKRQQLHHGSGQRCRPCLSFHADGSRRHHVCRRHSHRKYQHHARQPDIQPCVDPTPAEHFPIGRTVQHQAAGCVQ